MTIQLSDEELKKAMRDADSLEKAGDFASAAAIYDRLVEVEPNNPKLWAFKGYCHYHNEQYEEALSAFDNAIKIKSNVPTALYYRARTFEKLGRLRDALSDYEMSAELSPEVDAFINIAMINKFYGRMNESKEALLKAVRLEPDNQAVKTLLDNLERGDSDGSLS